MSKVQKYSPEVRERAVRMVFEHQAEHESLEESGLDVQRALVRVDRLSATPGQQWPG